MALNCHLAKPDRGGGSECATASTCALTASTTQQLVADLTALTAREPSSLPDAASTAGCRASADPTPTHAPAPLQRRWTDSGQARPASGAGTLPPRARRRGTARLCLCDGAPACLRNVMTLTTLGLARPPRHIRAERGARSRPRAWCPGQARRRAPEPAGPYRPFSRLLGPARPYRHTGASRAVNRLDLLPHSAETDSHAGTASARPTRLVTPALPAHSLRPHCRRPSPTNALKGGVNVQDTPVSGHRSRNKVTNQLLLRRKPRGSRDGRAQTAPRGTGACQARPR